MNYLDKFGKTYTNDNGKAIINGKNGPYNGKISNESVKYGRNAASNNIEYIKSYTTKPLNPEDYDLSGLKQLDDDQFDKKINAANQAIDEDMSAQSTPMEFKYKYLPEEKVDPANINKMALMGTAFEELGKKLSVSTAELTAKWKNTFNNKEIEEKLSAEAIDINKDGQVDVGEYSTSILLADMLSTDPQNLDAKNIKGEINDNGQKYSLPYFNKKNIEKASELFKGLYNFFGLNQAATEFANDKNNLA